MEVSVTERSVWSNASSDASGLHGAGAGAGAGVGEEQASQARVRSERMYTLTLPVATCSSGLPLVGAEYRHHRAAPRNNNSNSSGSSSGSSSGGEPGGHLQTDRDVGVGVGVGVGSVEAERLSLASAPLSGSFDVGWVGSYTDEWGNGQPADYVTVPHDASAAEFRKQILELRDVGRTVKVTRTGGCAASRQMPFFFRSAFRNAGSQSNSRIRFMTALH